MASGARDLIVDDEYFSRLAGFFKERNELETMLDGYISTLKESRESAIKSGDAAVALDEFIGYAERLKGKAREISYDLRDVAKEYVQAIDAADNFLF